MIIALGEDSVEPANLAQGVCPLRGKGQNFGAKKKAARVTALIPHTRTTWIERIIIIYQSITAQHIGKTDKFGFKIPIFAR